MAPGGGRSRPARGPPPHEEHARGDPRPGARHGDRSRPCAGRHEDPTRPGDDRRSRGRTDHARPRPDASTAGSRPHPSWTCHVRHEQVTGRHGARDGRPAPRRTRGGASRCPRRASSTDAARPGVHRHDVPRPDDHPRDGPGPVGRCRDGRDPRPPAPGRCGHPRSVRDRPPGVPGSPRPGVHDHRLSHDARRHRRPDDGRRPRSARRTGRGRHPARRGKGPVDRRGRGVHHGRRPTTGGPTRTRGRCRSPGLPLVVKFAQAIIPRRLRRHTGRNGKGSCWHDVSAATR